MDFTNEEIEVLSRVLQRIVNQRNNCENASVVKCKPTAAQAKKIKHQQRVDWVNEQLRKTFGENFPLK